MLMPQPLCQASPKVSGASQREPRCKRQATGGAATATTAQEQLRLELANSIVAQKTTGKARGAGKGVRQSGRHTPATGGGVRSGLQTLAVGGRQRTRPAVTMRITGSDGTVRLRSRGGRAVMSTETAGGSWMIRAGETRAGTTRTAGPRGATGTTAVAGTDGRVSVERPAAPGVEAEVREGTSAAPGGKATARFGTVAPDSAAPARGGAVAARDAVAEAVSTATMRVVGALRTTVTAMVTAHWGVMAEGPGRRTTAEADGS